ncbi:endonuclease domain-containing protein [Mesorhizobium sp. WSM4935]|uniref:endonuclease domain-containing protein n=1 Tax=Mesorhizobium sp. WSM4935 TaxID=3038547 RepID=UPI00241531FD|nr:endonuclease domain-containing protein [Mesorhizobium sp. WSM4935]MDG4878444.1 endonuclease domain-containing protein [Mesorhizobium sp. WSM4935]
MPHTPLPPKQRANARSMRKVMTAAELKLWNELRAHRLMGLGFRRQFPIAGYIVDFACPQKKLVVEVDGSQHGEADAVAGDEARTARLEKEGWTVLRFWNDDVIRDIDNVCQHIVIVTGLGSPSE